MGIAYVVPAFADAHQASKLRLTIGPRGHQIESIEYDFWRLAAKALQEVEGDLTAFVERHNFAVDDGNAGKFQKRIRYASGIARVKSFRLLGALGEACAHL